MSLNFKYYKTGPLVLLISVLALIFTGLKGLIGPHIHASEFWLTLNDYLGWVSPVAFIGVFLFLINEYFWKYAFMHWLIEIPDLNGRYVGELISSFIDTNGQPVKKDCVIEIKQNASGIHICSYYADKGSKLQTSMAFSVAEEIVKEKNGSFSLFYIFTNEPDIMLDALNKHSGTAKFGYLTDKKQLNGEYYNHRLNKGTMTLTFVGTKCYHRFEQ